jgi:argininosuccinate lyase
VNLPSGYHRDFQLLKEKIFPAFEILNDCLAMTGLMLSNVKIKDNILEDEKYKYLFSVEEVNKLVLTGVPFRDAYIKIGKQIEEGKFTYSTKINHTHEGSIGNLCNDKIKENFNRVYQSFQFDKIEEAIKSLLK